ncbi:hypothetical protein [Marinicauda pacifica]|jgi:hypothetical protein|uniref:hypothetical protein n=1 Tax=Marinicauda pacifica TaxID=1133559 RepID=UPI0035C7CBBF
MFIGHYGPAFAGVRAARSVPLWVLFLAVQAVDIAWGILVALDIEKLRIVPGFTEVNAFDLYFMPYTHSLPATLAFSLGGGAIYALLARTEQVRGGVVVGLAIASHWSTDLLVHVPDLALWPGGPRVGFGLWQHFWPAMMLEGALLLLGFVLYLGATSPRGLVGRVAPLVLLLGLAGLQIIPVTAPPAEDAASIGLSSALVFVLLTGLAALVDWTRRPASPSPRG